MFTQNLVRGRSVEENEMKTIIDSMMEGVEALESAFQPVYVSDPDPEQPAPEPEPTPEEPSDEQSEETSSDLILNDDQEED